MLTTRRNILAGLTASAAAAAVPAHARSTSDFTKLALRGGIDAGEQGFLPGAEDDGSGRLAGLIEKAARADMPLFLPPGTYVVSNLTLPDNTRITGIPGATRLVYGGRGHMLIAENRERIELRGIAIDGANHALADYARALVQTTGVARLVVEDCEITGSARFAVATERTGGRIERNQISGAAESGLYTVSSTGLSVSGNHVHDCGNGGILIHRWEDGADGSIVRANRVERIRSDSGGTGQNGNGINVFRAANVTIADNQIADCAFSALRSNAGSNVIMTGNHCLRSGETAIYSEFGFEGAMIAGNIVDGAANGISIANFMQGGRLSTVANNIVRNLTTKAPYEPQGSPFGCGIGAEADTAITGNVIEKAPTWGMQLGWGPYLRNITATGNVIRSAGTGIAVSVVEGARSALIANNVFQDVAAGAVVGYRWADAQTGNLAETGAQTFAHLTITGNRVS